MWLNRTHSKSRRWQKLPALIGEFGHTHSIQLEISHDYKAFALAFALIISQIQSCTNIITALTLKTGAILSPATTPFEFGGQ